MVHYPKFLGDDYQFAREILSTHNCVTIQELKKYRKKTNKFSPGEYKEQVSTFDAVEINLGNGDNNEDICVCEIDVTRTLRCDFVENTFETAFGTPRMPETSHLSRLHENSHFRISPITEICIGKLHRAVQCVTKCTLTRGFRLVGVTFWTIWTGFFSMMMRP